jgi:phosphate transport system substrate-binding protein
VIKKIEKITALIIFMVFASVMSLMSACGINSGTVIIVAGSTSVQPYAEILAEEYKRLYPDKVVYIQGGGSSAGIASVQSDTADIGMSSRPLKDSEQVWSVEIAKDGLALIVHPDNPVKNLTLEQVRGIYAQTITNWNEIGGHNANIHIIAREEGSGTRSAFEELVMNKEFITPKAIVQASNGAVKQLVSGDKNAIGFISLGLVDEKVKSVQLDSVTATLENVMNGSYTLFRPFLFVTDTAPEGLARQFIDFTLSAEGQKILMNEGLVPQIEIIEK